MGPNRPPAGRRDCKQNEDCDLWHLVFITEPSKESGSAFKGSKKGKLNMQKVLFLIRSRAFGGLQIVLLDWLAGIDYKTTSVTVASYNTALFLQLLAKNGLPVHCIDLPSPDQGPLWRVFPKWISFYFPLRPQKIVFLEGGIPDFDLTAVFLAYCFSRGNLYPFESTAPEPLPKAAKLPLGLLPGRGLFRYKKILDYRIREQLARHTFTASCGTRDKLNAYYGYPTRRTSVLYHGVDTERFRPSLSIRTDFRREHGIPEDAIVILSHGRLDRNKRVDRIMRAFEMLASKHENLWLLLTAHSAHRQELEVASLRAAAGTNVRHRLKFLDFQEDISKMVQASDIYVLASDSEGFGIALVEAMSAGLICVATKVTGPPEIIADAKSGFLVEASDDGVLNGLRRALDLGDNERESMRRQARMTVLEKFDLRRNVRRALESLQIPVACLPGAGAKC